jgi:hypothetical protein
LIPSAAIFFATRAVYQIRIIRERVEAAHWWPQMKAGNARFAR